MYDTKTLIIRLLPIYLVGFIDSIGLSMVAPLITPLFYSSDGFLNISQPLSRSLLYGATYGVYCLFMFIGSPILGFSSDKKGRKQVLMICLLGTCIGYIISSIGIMVNSISLFFIGRIIDGFTAASIVVSKAAIIDLTKQAQMKYVGLFMGTLAIGYVFGPLLSSIIYHAFYLSTPGLFISGLAMLNCILLHLFYVETNTVAQYDHESESVSHYLLTCFKGAIENKKVLSVSICNVFFVISWFSYSSFMPMFLTFKYQQTPAQVAYYFSLNALFMLISGALIVNSTVKLLGSLKTFYLSSMITAVCIGLMLYFSSIYILWIALVPIALGYMHGYVIINKLYSDQVIEANQGWVMGISSAVSALFMALTGFMVGFLGNTLIEIPLALSMLSALLSSIYLYYVSNRLTIEDT